VLADAVMAAQQAQLRRDRLAEKHAVIVSTVTPTATADQVSMGCTIYPVVRLATIRQPPHCTCHRPLAHGTDYACTCRLQPDLPALPRRRAPHYNYRSPRCKLSLRLERRTLQSSRQRCVKHLQSMLKKTPSSGDHAYDVED
jgi:hypothetical protein